MKSLLGNIPQNTRSIIRGIEKAKRLNADVVFTPELAVTGYFPKVIMRRPDFLERNMEALDEIAKHTIGITAIVGFMRFHESPLEIFNSAAVIRDGEHIHTYDKIKLLPQGYGSNYEVGHFSAGTSPYLFPLEGKNIWLSICNDLWVKDEGRIAKIRDEADIILSLNASGYDVGVRIKLLTTLARSIRTYIFYVNHVGFGFNSQSMIIRPDGSFEMRIASAMKEELVVCEL